MKKKSRQSLRLGGIFRFCPSSVAGGPASRDQLTNTPRAPTDHGGRHRVIRAAAYRHAHRRRGQAEKHLGAQEKQRENGERGLPARAMHRAQNNANEVRVLGGIGVERIRCEYQHDSTGAQDGGEQ